LTRRPHQKSALAGAFGAAADAYHGAADVQRDVAARLAGRIAAIPPRPQARVLEIGCGTGFLHQALAPNLPGATWLLSDLSETMVRRARTRIGPVAQFIVMDGESPAFGTARFDLVCASLVFQWFDDLDGSLNRLASLLAPGGLLAFTTLTAESFPEWRRAHEAVGARSAVRAYPAASDIERMAPSGTKMRLEVEQIVRRYQNAHQFLMHWKQIGTHLPDTNRAPLTPGTMRKLLRQFEDGITVTYDVAYGLVHKL
jgi:malonyl-CoA O-methyltransferase